MDERKTFRGFDHVDTRVHSLAHVEEFYDQLMPALGLTVKRHCQVDEHGDWIEGPSGAQYNVAEYYEPAVAGQAARFIGFVEDPMMKPIATRIAFRLESERELADWPERLVAMGAVNIEPSESDDYPALFFEDPCGTRLELCARRSARNA